MTTAIPVRFTKHPNASAVGQKRIVQMPTGWVYLDQDHYDRKLGQPGLQVRLINPGSESRVFQNGDGSIELTEIV